MVTSEQGSQFAGQWFQTMCARLGIREAFSQAYHPQANGRAEVAGKQLIECLRKIHAEEEVNWVEALPWRSVTSMIGWEQAEFHHTSY